MALKAGDALGFEVLLSREELESVRGESIITTAFGTVVNYISNKFGSDIRFTIFSPLTACAPTKDRPTC